MKYDLAKELAEAGYPQNKWGHAVNEMGSHITFGGEPIDGFYHVPKLNKLIESCPNKLKIEDWFDGDFTLKFWLEGEQQWHAGYEHCDGWYEGGEGTGSTPEEAVARLWISLNKKEV